MSTFRTIAVNVKVPSASFENVAFPYSGLGEQNHVDAFRAVLFNGKTRTSTARLPESARTELTKGGAQC